MQANYNSTPDKGVVGGIATLGAQVKTTVKTDIRSAGNVAMVEGATGVIVNTMIEDGTTIDAGEAFGVMVTGSIWIKSTDDVVEGDTAAFNIDGTIAKGGTIAFTQSAIFAETALAGNLIKLNLGV